MKIIVIYFRDAILLKSIVGYLSKPTSICIIFLNFFNVKSSRYDFKKTRFKNIFIYKQGRVLSFEKDIIFDTDKVKLIQNNNLMRIPHRKMSYRTNWHK